MNNVNKRDCSHIWLRRKTSTTEHKYSELKVQLDKNTTRGEAIDVMEQMLAGCKPEEHAMASVVLTNGCLL